MEAPAFAMSTIELLEPRVAPAAVITYTDIDGDIVKITASKGPLDAGDLIFVGGGSSGQLATLSLTDAAFTGANITFSVTKAAGGNGLADVGRIDAGTNDLGNVVVKGDLGVIDAGSGSATRPAIKSLSVRSMGIYGVATQGGVGDLESNINGALGALRVQGDVKDAIVRVFGAPSATIGSITIGGSLIGGSGNVSGSIRSQGDMGPVRIGGDVVGGSRIFAGFIETLGNLASVTIGGSLIGGSSFDSGEIRSTGNMGPVKIRHDVVGGEISGAGSISSRSLASLNIGGSLIGGTGSFCGSVHTFNNMGPVKIGGNLTGGSIFADAAADVVGSGLIQSDHRIASVFIGGSIVSGLDESTSFDLSMSASIRAGDNIGSITVKGGIIGTRTDIGESPVIISARGQLEPTGTSDVAIGKISVGGRVDRTLILAGYSVDVEADNTAAAAVNANAQIGSVRVGGDWLASSIAAGVVDTGNNGFGNADDTVIGGSASTAKIASITIRGVVSGTATSGDHFGFVSHQISAFTSLGFRAPLSAGTNVIELSSITGDVTVREV